MADKNYPTCYGCEFQSLLLLEELCFFAGVKLAAPSFWGAPSDSARVGGGSMGNSCVYQNLR